MSRATLEISSEFSSNFPLKRYSTVRIVSCLPFELVFILGICKISWSLKFEYNPKRGYWDIPLLIFLGNLPQKFVLIFRICKIWFGHISLSLLEYDPIIGCWDIPLWIFEFVLHWPILQAETFKIFSWAEIPR